MLNGTELIFVIAVLALAVGALAGVLVSKAIKKDQESGLVDKEIVQCEETHRCGHRWCSHHGPHEPIAHCDGAKKDDFGVPAGCPAGECEEVP